MALLYKLRLQYLVKTLIMVHCLIVMILLDLKHKARVTSKRLRQRLKQRQHPHPHHHQQQPHHQRHLQVQTPIASSQKPMAAADQFTFSRRALTVPSMSSNTSKSMGWRNPLLRQQVAANSTIKRPLLTFQVQDKFQKQQPSAESLVTSTKIAAAAVSSAVSDPFWSNCSTH